MSDRVADPRFGRDLDLLAELSRAISDFVRQEEKLLQAIRQRRNASNRKHRDGRAQVSERLAAALEQTRAEFDEEESRIKHRYETRRARIDRAQANTSRTLQARARQAKEKRLSELQLQHLQAERALPIRIKEADTAAAEFVTTITEQDGILRAVEGRARRAFTGFSFYRTALEQARAAAPLDEAAGSPEDIYVRLQTALEDANATLTAFRGDFLPKFFAAVPFALVIALALIGAAVMAFALGFTAPSLQSAGIGAAIAIALAAFAFVVARRQARPAAIAVANGVVEARRLRELCVATATARHAEQRQHIQEGYERTWNKINDEWGRADEIETRFAKAGRTKISEQMMRVLGRHERSLGPRLRRVAPERDQRLAELQSDADALLQEFDQIHAGEIAAVDVDEQELWIGLERDWKERVVPLYLETQSVAANSAQRFPEWSAEFVENWTPPAEFATAARLGHLQLDLTRHALPKDPRLALPGPALVTLPVALTFPDKGSLLFETSDTGNATVIGSINNIILRLFASSPAGKLSFTIIDPIGLGQNFAGLMHLSDYEESLIDRRIWTQRDQIEERLAELNEHIEKVIQMYLRDEFETISEYNAQAGSVAEKYHFLVIADFPGNFSEAAAKRLQSIAVSGPRCGVFTLIHWDRRHPAPDGLVSEELRKSAVWIHRENGELVLSSEQLKTGVSLLLDSPPEPAVAAALVHKIGKCSVDSNRVEVPFSQIAPAPEDRWKGDTTSELRVAIGRTGATKLQYLSIGKGTRQHALFAGKTGSGKSTLFHVIITNLALSCSPDEVEFYLIDFKKGVEFKCYASKHLPHARVIAIESDREFGLSVLQRVDEELKRRGDIFRSLGVQDIPGYKRAGGKDPMPRTLLMIDEFQEFFIEDDTIAQSASMLFDRIVRQGRAFGIHVLLGSQTLGGAYTLARATLGQMVIRVALQCNEADAYLIMDDNNPAPRLLSRPGEGIYNDAAGAVEGNSPFQVVWLGDDERDALLDQIHALSVASDGHRHGPIVFEGNAPADARENELFRGVMDRRPTTKPLAPRCWLGAPNSIKGPTEAVFHRQSGNNLLIVGQREETALTLILLSIVALSAQHPPETAKFTILHSAPPGSAEADLIAKVAEIIPHELRVARPLEVGSLMSELATDLHQRSTAGESSESAPTTFAFIHGIQKYKKLRQEDDFNFSSSDDKGGNPGAQFTELLTEGSSHGIHLIVTVDTFNNVNRSMSRKALGEFEMRVLFQMSANDSASLIDSPKASGLGLHRALFYNEQEGTLETFRPYAMPGAEWLEEVAPALQSPAPIPSGQST